MKYTIHGFSQRKALEFGLKSDELLILRWFVDFMGTSRMKKFTVDEEQFFWVKYDFILEQLPILKCNKKNLAAKFKKLVNADILKNKTLKKGGTYSLYCIGERYEELISDTPEVETEGYPKTGNGVAPKELEGYSETGNGVTQKQAEGCSKTGKGLPENSLTVTRKQVNKDSSCYSSSYSSCKDICSSDEEREPELTSSQKKKLLQEYFEKFYMAYPKKRAKNNAEKAFMKLKPDKEFLESVLSSLEEQKKSDDWLKDNGQYIPYPASWINAGNWEDELTVTIVKPQENNTAVPGLPEGVTSLEEWERIKAERSR